MPAVWKNMTEENRRASFEAIKSFYADSNEGDGGVWNEMNLRQLVQYVAIDELPALRASFFIAKEDPSVFKTPVCVVPPPSSAVSSSRIDEFEGYSWRPPQLLQQFNANKFNTAGPLMRNQTRRDLAPASQIKVQNQLYSKITNHVAIHHTNKNPVEYKSKSCLLPSPHLDCAVHNEQLQMLNPTPQDMFMGYVIDHSVGEKAHRRVAKRTVDMISGGVASYSRCLTNDANMKRVQETYDVAAGMAILTEEKNSEKNVRSETKRIEDERKKQEKLEKLAAEAQKKFELMPKNQLDLAQGLEHVLKLTNVRKAEILRYTYNMNVTRLNKLKKEGLNKEIRERFIPATVDDDANTSQDGNKIASL